VQHLLGCEVLPHPPSCCPENRFHKAANTNISLVQFFGDVSTAILMIERYDAIVLLCRQRWPRVGLGSPFKIETHFQSSTNVKSS
jgi:hypothetical protein